MGLKNNMKEKLVTVAIVTYNREKELKRALDSVLAQTYKNIEIIIVDNNSADSTVKMITENYKMVKLIKSPTNVGCPQGRNIAIDNSNGKIIFFLDDDAWYERNVVESIMKRFKESHSNVGAIMTNIIEYIGNKKYVVFNEKEERRITNFLGGAIAFKRNVFQEIGFFPNLFYGGEENYLALRMYVKQIKIIFMPNVYIHHKPGVRRNENELFFFRSRNDMIWVWTFCPHIILIPLFIVKSFSWLKFGFQHHYFLAILKGLFVGMFKYVIKANKDRYKIDVCTFINFLKDRKQSLDPISIKQLFESQKKN